MNEKQIKHISWKSLKEYVEKKPQIKLTLERLMEETDKSKSWSCGFSMLKQMQDDLDEIIDFAQEENLEIAKLIVDAGLSIFMKNISLIKDYFETL